jgi:hypothetical protein
MEELKCLDKVWHKQCFKCTVCGMTLNMKTYKGYDKKPYCEPHYPKTIASVVADTPEMSRLARNTQLQSQVKYHADYEKMKGTKIEVADDPELQRHRQNTKVQSQVQYHGELEKKRQQESNRPNEELTSSVPSSTSATIFPVHVNYANSIRSVEGEKNNPAHIANNNGTSSSDNHNAMTAYGTHDKDSPYSQRLASQAGITVYSSDNGGRVSAQQRQVGSIADYDPLAAEKTHQQSESVQQQASKQQQQQQKGGAGDIKSTGTVQAAAGGKAPSKNTGFTVKALYDYTAADKDEVTFKENDIIVNCEKVDDGWLTGTVQRTLTWGMLPANYVERVNQPTGLFKLN